MKIPVKIYQTIQDALILQNEINQSVYTDKRNRNARDHEIENAFKWLYKHKRKIRPSTA